MLKNLHFIHAGCTSLSKTVKILIWLAKKKRFTGGRVIKQQNKYVPILIELDGKDTLMR